MTAPAVPIDRARPIPIDSALRIKLDRCGLLLEDYRRHKPWIDELEKLKKEIRATCANEAAELPVRLEGGVYYIDLGPRENEKRITDKAKAFAALRKAMSMEKLIEALEYTFKLLDRWVPEPLQKKFVIKELTGSRTITAVRKEAPEAA